MRINVPNGNLDVSRGVDNTSVSASMINGDTTYSLARKVDYSEFKSGIEFSETTNTDDENKTFFVNASVNGGSLMAWLSLLTTGQFAPQFAYAN